jgi:hypothetical protein
MPTTAAEDPARVDAQAAQALKAGLRHVIFRQARDKGGLFAEESEGYRHVGFAAAKGHFENGGLIESEKTRRGQAQHDFSEGDYFHGGLILGKAR